jgi:hypothetical protein
MLRQMPDGYMLEADLGKRRKEAFEANAHSEGRLGSLRTVFDGWGVAVVAGEPTPESTVVIPNPDYDLLADALERGMERCSFNSRYGEVATRSDGDADLSNYDWNLDVTGKVTVPRAQVRPLIELLRSVPAVPWIGFGVGRGEEYCGYDLEVVHRGLLDPRGQPWTGDAPLIELFRALRPSEGRRGKRFLTTLDLDVLLSRRDGEPLRVSTSEGDLILDGAVVDRVIPRLHRALRPVPRPL